MSIQTIEANLSDLRYVLREIKKREREGTLPKDGQLTLITDTAAEAMTFQVENDPNSPDCSTFGKVKAVVRASLNVLELDKKVKDYAKEHAYRFAISNGSRAPLTIFPFIFSDQNQESAELLMNEGGYRLIRDGLIKALPEQLVKVGSKLLFYSKILKNVQMVFETSYQTLVDHNRKCSVYQAGMTLPTIWAETKIAKLTYNEVQPTILTSLPEELLNERVPKVKLKPPTFRDHTDEREQEKSDNSNAVIENDLSHLEGDIRDTQTEELCSQSISIENFFDHFSQKIVEFAGSLTGITPMINEVNRLRDIIEVIVKNPSKGPMTVVSEIFNTPENQIKTLLSAPESLIKNGESLLNGTESTLLGAFSIVSTIMATIQSVNWVMNFANNPSRAAIEMITMPIDSIRNVVNLGMSLIRDPENTSKLFFKSIIKSPENSIKKFARNVGLKKKKKKKKKKLRAPKTILPKQLHEIKKQKSMKYANDLMSLYMVCREHWYVDPYKTVEVYHYDLLEDWKSGHAADICGGDYFNFPSVLEDLFRQSDYEAVLTLSPKAHLNEPLAPPEVAQAISRLLISDVQLNHASVQLIDAVEREENNLKTEFDNMKKLGEACDTLHEVTEEFHILLTTNREQIRAALKQRMLEKTDLSTKVD